MGLILCERCAAIVAEEEREDRAIAAILPPHIHMYDFGDGVTTMPVPNFADSGGSYLTTSVAYLHSDDNRFLPVEIRFHQRKPGGKKQSILDESNFIAALTNGVERFEKHARKLDDKGRLPMLERNASL